MTRQTTPRGWRAQYAPGRVFELKRKTYDGAPICVLAIAPSPGGRPETWPGGGRYFVQVDARGCTEGPYARARSRFYAGALHPARMSGALIRRRRPDLERFDADDLALIRYGMMIEFGGKIRTCITQAALPQIPGKRWTVFWTKACPWSWTTSEAGRVLNQMLQGHWHLHSHCGGNWTFGRDSCLDGWATTDTDPARLRRIEAHLRRHLPHLEVQVIEMTATAYDDRTVIAAHGLPCPALAARGTTTLWANGGRSYSLAA